MVSRLHSGRQAKAAKEKYAKLVPRVPIAIGANRGGAKIGCIELVVKSSLVSAAASRSYLGRRFHSPPKS